MGEVLFDIDTGLPIDVNDIEEVQPLFTVRTCVLPGGG